MARGFPSNRGTYPPRTRRQANSASPSAAVNQDQYPHAASTMHLDGQPLFWQNSDLRHGASDDCRDSQRRWPTLESRCRHGHDIRHQQRGGQYTRETARGSAPPCLSLEPDPTAATRASSEENGLERVPLGHVPSRLRPGGCPFGPASESYRNRPPDDRVLVTHPRRPEGQRARWAVLFGFDSLRADTIVPVCAMPAQYSSPSRTATAGEGSV